MAGSINEVTLLGNLGADPEIRTTQDGRAIANLRIATSETWKDKTTGEKKERVEWHRVVIFNDNLARIAEQYLRKGSKVYVRGQLATRKWKDQQGAERYSTEITLQGFQHQLVLLDKREGSGYPPAANSPDDYGRTNTRGAYGMGDPNASGGYGSGQTMSDNMQSPLDQLRTGGGAFDKDLDDEIPF